jgi:hypothetical protein
VDPRITILGGISVILASLPALAIQLETRYSGLVAGFSILAFFAAVKLFNRKILEESTGRRTKAFQDLVETVSVFLVIGSAGLTEIIPGWLAVLTVGLLGVTKVFQLQMSRRYRKNFRFTVGEDYWIILTSIIFLGSYINSYFLFYGMAALSLILVYDLSSLTRKIKR